ncbi:hypothetical protein HU200_030860 [Digitaria exilis]|uniref:Pentatricopeptide repeat-containing protein n=1 Tax=Digitaria exilis TaxID=1010633 RepID=A0A835BSD0_9POAL|nr:hypothetical protein HU200_030860 [Digitaria exilis]
MLLNIPYCKSQAPVAAVAAISSLRFSSSSSPALIPPPSEPLASPSPALVEENLFAALLASDPPPPEPLRLVLAAGDVHSALRGLPGLARQLFRWAEDTPRGFPRTASAFAAVLVPLAQANHIRAAYPVSLRALHLGLLLPLVSFLLSTDISPATKSLLSSSYACPPSSRRNAKLAMPRPPPEGREDKAAMVLKEMETQGIGCLPNDVTYNVVILGLPGKVRNLAMAREFFDEMLSKGLQPDCFAYNTRICAELALGSASKAFQLREVMMLEGISSDIVTYNILIDGLCKTGNLKDAEDLQMKMLNDGLQPDCITYTCLIHAHCERGLLKEARKYFYKMISDRLPPSAVTYTVLIHAY